MLVAVIANSQFDIDICALNPLRTVQVEGCCGHFVIEAISHSFSKTAVQSFCLLDEFDMDICMNCIHCEHFISLVPFSQSFSSVQVWSVT